ncbi:hypothetical protein [uncultured Tateyamaria sp.]|uniref:hypothetical protein n=1 Tax=uncultured Tateyamaria sp. TaxID=455651 RepID=UPI00262AD130|nr:hypothetical protein [uncultured Tateyamaria sp.]
MIYLIIPIALFFMLSCIAFVSFRFASTYPRDEENLESGQHGCLLTLASLFLRPVPIIFAFYVFGFIPAVVVALAMWLFSRCLEFYRGKIGASADWRLLVLPLGAGLTLFTENYLYFQLIPSAWCALNALEQLVALILKKTQLFGENSETGFSKEEVKLARYGILATCLIALGISEYCRHNLSLSNWIWYYGYLRLEFLPIMLGSIAPAMIKMIRRSEGE